MIRQCCVCSKIDLDGNWVKPASDSFVKGICITHTYCPSCLELAQAEHKQQLTALSAITPR